MISFIIDFRKIDFTGSLNLTLGWILIAHCPLATFVGLLNDVRIMVVWAKMQKWNVVLIKDLRDTLKVETKTRLNRCVEWGRGKCGRCLLGFLMCSTQLHSKDLLQPASPFFITSLHPAFWKPHTNESTRYTHY